MWYYEHLYKQKQTQWNSSERLLTKVQNEDSESLSQDTEGKNKVTKMGTGKMGIGKPLGIYCADSQYYLGMDVPFSFSFWHHRYIIVFPVLED